jgi:hypothetical protein
LGKKKKKDSSAPFSFTIMGILHLPHVREKIKIIVFDIKGNERDFIHVRWT